MPVVMKEIDPIIAIHRERDRFLAITSAGEIAALLGTSEQDLLLYALNPFYTPHRLRKRNGSVRLIEQPEKALKKMQEALNRYLQAVYFFTRPKSVYGFARSYHLKRDRRNIITQARKHLGKECVIRLDLQDFFHSINAARVRDMFQGAPFHFPRPAATLLALLTTYNDRLPMGAPTSPILSNLVFLETDFHLEEVSKELGYAYTRYADDLIFSGANPENGFIPQISSLIEKQGFKVNTAKTRIQHNTFRQVATGIKVNFKPNVDRKYIRNIRAALHDWQQNGLITAASRYNSHATTPDADPVQLYQASLFGKIAFVGQVRGKHDRIYRVLAKIYGELGRMRFE